MCEPRLRRRGRVRENVTGGGSDSRGGGSPGSSTSFPGARPGDPPGLADSAGDSGAILSPEPGHGR